MEKEHYTLNNAPIVEAVIEIGCDMPPTLNVADLEQPLKGLLGAEYIEIRQIFRDDLEMKLGTASPDVKSKRALHALQFRNAEQNQIVQAMTTGFAFNRLKPYVSLDDYLPEIERGWRHFVNCAKPLQVRTIKLRYINRILIPLDKDGLIFSEYLKIAPSLPLFSNLKFTGFFNHYTAVEEETGHQAQLLMHTEVAADNRLPFIFDNAVEAQVTLDVDNWKSIVNKIESLRSLKNRIFKNAFTTKCLEPFQ